MFLLWFDITSPSCYSHLSILHFAEQSHDPWPTNKQKEGKNDKKSDRKISAICTRRSSAISCFPPLAAEENWKIDCTADERSGEAAVSSFPPPGAEENWKIDFTADENRGKAALSSFPPLGAEENWKIDFTADESSGKAAISSFPPLWAEKTVKSSLPPVRPAVKQRQCPNKVARTFYFQST